MKHSLSYFPALFCSLFLSALLMGSIGQNDAVAQSCTTIQYGSFFRDASYLIAEREGFFTKEGLCVNYNQVKSSVQQFDDFLAGKFDIIATAVDNVSNRIVNKNLPISIISAADKGADFVLAVNTSLGIHSVADLRGKAIMVDAPDSGFVFALRKIMAANGLYYEKGDFTYQLIGGTSLRFNYLQDGKIPSGEPAYATMLIYPFTARASSSIAVAARFSDYIAPYQTNGLAVTHDGAAKNGKAYTAFLRAYIKAGRFLFDPANHDKIIADMVAGYGVSTTVAEAELKAALDPVSGQNVDARMSKKGLYNVISLRQEFNGFSQPVDIKKFIKPAKNGFYDNTFWKAAYHSLDDEDDHEGDHQGEHEGND